MNGIKQNRASQTNRMRCNKTVKQMSLGEMKTASTSAPLSDGQVEPKQTSEGQS